MSVHRLTVLPVAPNRGRLLVPASVAESTRCALQEFRGAETPHEGLVYWAGRCVGNDTVAICAIVPRCDHSPFGVFVSEREVGRMSRHARSLGLAVVAQVHSHPGDDTRHSDGDDELILMPTDGMFSLVVARYGAGGIHPATGAGLHQYQDKRWVRIPAECTDALTIVPSAVDLRNV